MNDRCLTRSEKIRAIMNVLKKRREIPSIGMCAAIDRALGVSESETKTRTKKIYEAHAKIDKVLLTQGLSGFLEDDDESVNL